MLSPIAFLQRMTASLLTGDSPRRVAGGFTLGMILGLVPKGNLIAVLLCVLVFALRINKGVAIAAAVLFSFIGPWADPFTHKLGVIVLTLDSLQAVYAWVYSQPLGPWLGFHNTVVTGSSLMGMYLAYPAYWLVGAVCRRAQASATSDNALAPQPTSWEARPQHQPLHGAAP